MNLNDLNALSALTIIPPQAITATITGAAIDLQQYQGVLKVTLTVGVVSGTAPTLDGKIQTSVDTTSGDFADVTGYTFTEVTASTASISILVDTRSVKRYIRFIGTMGGSSTPTFNLAVTAVVLPKKVGYVSSQG